MAAGLKKRYKILFFVFPKKSQVHNGLTRDTTYRKRAKQLAIGGVMIFIVAVAAVYLKNNHEFVIDISNKFSEYINLYTNTTSTSREVRHIGFLKVHKAGGSTVQNVLFRFGVKRNLSFVMPFENSQYKFTTYGGKCSELIRNKDGRYDILALHSAYNETAYSQVLWPGTVNIAIVREPLALMISGAYFHRDVWQLQYLKLVPEENYIKNLIRYPELYDQNEFSLTKNTMAMDFGFPSGFHISDTKDIELYLEYLDSKFTLVMVLEYFDESMVLLKRLLHWHFDDILYIPLNAYKHPTEKELNISANDRRKFQDRNFLDVAIYRYFKEKFIQVVSALGFEFQDEVNHFRQVRKDVEDHCISGTKRKRPLYVEESLWNRRFAVTESDCEAMLTSELKFIDRIRSSMKQERIRVRRHYG